MIAYSVALQKVLAEAKRIAEKQGHKELTQIHFLLGLTSLRFPSELDFTTDRDFIFSINKFTNTEEGLNRAVTHAYDYIRLNEPDAAEVEAMKVCFTRIAQSMEDCGYEVLDLPSVVCEIFRHPSENVKKLFGEILPKQREESVSEEEEIEEVKPTSSDILSPIKYLQERLRQKVYGQDEAINALVSGYFNLVVNDSSKSTKPKATFLFAGAPGVGKTHLAQTMAAALHLPHRRFDMSSFADKEAPLEFAGTDRVYKGAHEGLVTGFVNKHPRCVLIFDEIEKAHINIIHLFLQILDAGKLKDSYLGRSVSFSDAIIIMTTNAGKSLYENLEPGSPKPNRKTVLNALSTEKNPYTGAAFFPEAICSRFASGNVILFNPLGTKELTKIGFSALNESAAVLSKKFNFKIEIDKNLCDALLFSEGGRADARSLCGRASNFINSEVYNWLKFAYEKDKEGLNSLEEIKVKIQLTPESLKLFGPSEKQNVLLYSEYPSVFLNFESSGNINLLKAKTPEEAVEFVNDNDIAFAVCDIFGNEPPTLNIEDTTSEGRELMGFLVREHIPTFVFRQDARKINTEEVQALLENGASGFINNATKPLVAKNLREIGQQVFCAKTLYELGRSKKVLTFDCNYLWSKNKTTGTINLSNLRVIPAVDAQDKGDLAEVSAVEVCFDDIIGADDAKAELKNFIAYLKNPKLYAKNKVPAPKGVMLYGPPGTGKTMLAKAFAHESGAAFIATHGNNFLSSTRGGGAQEVKRLFALARKYAPAVLFIDEIDIVAKDRFSSSLADDVVNALLNEMDGFSTNSSRPVFVLGATNFDVAFGKESALDSALLRRFDRRLFVDLPNAKERKIFITNRLAKSKQSLSEAVVDNIVTRSVGMSFAELESIIDFALRTMLQNSQTALTEEMFNEQFETYCYGESHTTNEAHLRRVAVHEAGHALVSCFNGNIPTYITITGRGNFGGYVHSDISEDPDTITKKVLLNRIRLCLGGRAAEMVVYGQDDGVSVGATSDLLKATKVAMNMINLYGMSAEHGLASFEENVKTPETVELCNKILEEELEKAIQILTENKKLLQNLVTILLEKNHLMAPELEEIFNSRSNYDTN